MYVCHLDDRVGAWFYLQRYPDYLKQYPERVRFGSLDNFLREWDGPYYFRHFQVGLMDGWYFSGRVYGYHGGGAYGDNYFFKDVNMYYKEFLELNPDLKKDYGEEINDDDCEEILEEEYPGLMEKIADIFSKYTHSTDDDYRYTPTRKAWEEFKILDNDERMIGVGAYIIPMGSGNTSFPWWEKAPTLELKLGTAICPDCSFVLKVVDNAEIRPKRVCDHCHVKYELVEKK